MLLLLLVGLGVGVISALLGLGGGVLLVPFLPGLTDWSSHQVVAVTLLIILGNSFANMLWYNKRGTVNWDVLIFWGPFAAIGSFTGSYFALKFTGENIRMALLALVGLMIIRFSLDFFKDPRSKKLFVSSDWNPLKGVFGFFVGTLSGFCGIGTGLVSNTLFMSRRWVLKDEVAPTGNGVMFFVSLASVASFLIFGKSQNIEMSFFLENWKQILMLMGSVFVSSFYLRPFNPLISDNLRFLCLVITLLSVFGYVLTEMF
ncbi:MAG: sulfite exporter TauE/SafE family protein [Bdellovibrionales bacterium]